MQANVQSKIKKDITGGKWLKLKPTSYTDARGIKS